MRKYNVVGLYVDDDLTDAVIKHIMTLTFLELLHIFSCLSYTVYTLDY